MIAVFCLDVGAERTGSCVAMVNIYDGADAYRIEISGNFAESAVLDVDRNWRKALSKKIQKITVDISQLSDYDRSGCKLLRKMHQHGTVIAAATPRSLIFLQEITAPQPRGPALLRETGDTKKKPDSPPNTKAVAAS